MTASSTPLLQVKGLSKRFPGVQALSKVDLTLQRGQILAVIGENGAGKSTLMKALAGVQQPDSGQILLNGQPITIGSPGQAIDLGIVLIHQELNLCDNLDAGANIFLGREPRRFGFVSRSQIKRQAENFLKDVGLDISPDTIVNTLTIGRQQMIEIAKSLSVQARILIMDEPSSSLSARETESLFRVIKTLRERGVSIVYISHRLGEVKELADSVTVLRDGENAGELSRDEINHDHMVNMMVGRDVSQFYARQERQVGQSLLEVHQLVTPAWPQHQLSFQLKAGEIVGISGLVGAGRTELLRVLFGIDRPVAGRILIEGKPVQVASPLSAIREGLALVPEDRKQHGLILEMSVENNIGLAGLRRYRLGGGVLNQKKERDDARRMIQEINIRTPHARQVVRLLSGGNQQKVVIGKWLSLGPRILLLDEPTRGIDVGAKEEIYKLMEKLAEDGMGILFVSSEMEEILGMSDRTLVMHEGRLMGELSRERQTEEAIMQLATGNLSTN